MKIFISYLLLLALLPASSAWAQNGQVSGTISDDKGPLDGVSVVEKGVPANGTTTNERGLFMLSLKGRTNTVIVSVTGYLTKEVTTTGTVHITMAADPKGLGEVIVVGYGRQKKITLTGSASSITGLAIRENPSVSLQNGLSGRLPGFSSQQRTGQPGTDAAQFFIRGVSSFVGNNQPLIIVDDIEYSYAQFAVIDPNEIESITILKDASTTAVFGIKGANGVVVVTTRRGNLGAPKIAVRTEYATMEPTILPKYLDAYNSALLYNQGLINDNKANPNPTFTPRFTDQDLQLFKNGKDPYGHPNIDWYNVLFKKFSHQTRTNLDISGGTDRVKYFVSLGYIDQGGSVKDFGQNQGINSNYFNKRYNYRSNLDINASKGLDIRVDLYGNTSQVNTPNVQTNSINGNKNSPFYEYASFYSLSPFAYPIKNPDGSWGYSNWQRNESGAGAYNGNNIVERLNYGGYQRTNNDNMSFTTSAVQKLDFITRGLSVKALASYASTYFYDRNITRSNMPSYMYDPVATTYTPRDVNIFTFDKFNLGYNGRQTTRDVTVQGILNYDRNFGDHHLVGLALFNRNSKTATSSNQAYNFIPVNFQGLTARIGYDYKQKYLFQFNGAYNGTDRFVAAKRFGFFPALSAGWNVAEEPFFKNNIPAVNLFKLRASYGVVGNDLLSSTALYTYQQIYFYNSTSWQTNSTNNTGLNVASDRIYQANFGTSSNQYNNLQEGSLANSNVTWEKENKFDIGVDFGLINSKLSGTVDIFNNIRYDILTQRGTVSQIFGQVLPQVNLGKTNNKGIEVELAYRDKIGKNFNYSIRGTYSYAINKILFQDEPSTQYPYQRFTGQSIGQQLIYKWTGTFYKDSADIAKSPRVLVGQGARPGDLKYEDVNGDGVIDAKDRGFFGRPNLPTTIYGLQLGAGYKGLNLSLAFQGATDFYVSAFEESIRPFSSNLQPIHQKAWTPALGDKAQFPALTVSNRGISDPGTLSTFWYRPGDYLRLRTAELSYSFPKSWLNKIRVADIKLYVNGNNLVTWSKVFKLYSVDPENNSGADFALYPPQKVYNIGLSVTF